MGLSIVFRYSICLFLFWAKVHDCSFIGNIFETNDIWFPTSVFFCNIVLRVPGPLYFHMNFRNRCPIPLKILCWELWSLCFLAQNMLCLGECLHTFEKKYILNLRIQCLYMSKIKLVDSLVVLSITEGEYKNIQLWCYIYIVCF